jgi:hypothetical protein
MSVFLSAGHTATARGPLTDVPGPDAPRAALAEGFDALVAEIHRNALVDHPAHVLNGHARNPTLAIPRTEAALGTPVAVPSSAPIENILHHHREGPS